MKPILPKDPAQPFRRVRSWWHNRHMVYRDVLAYDLSKGRFILNRNTINQNQIVADDLHIDGEKWRYFKTFLELPSVPATRTVIEDGEERVYYNPTPVSWNLYYESDVLNDAAVGEFKNKLLNPMMLAIILGIGAVCILFMLFR